MHIRQGAGDVRRDRGETGENGEREGREQRYSIFMGGESYTRMGRG